MYSVSKVFNYAKRKLWFLNPIGVVSRIYIQHINKKEFHSPPFPEFNERPIEYRFVFETISKYYPKKILDIGTGITALPHLMANCGAKVTAIDNIKDYWDYGVFNRHYYVLNDSIIEPKLKDTFDLVTCVSTLEHIERFDEAVESMLSFLNPGGYLTLSFPYNEKSFADNAYALPGSHVKKLPPFKAHVFSREVITRWIKDKAEVVDQEYWQVFTGDYWTVGERLAIPKKVSKDEKHQISCILIKKNSSV